MKLPIITTLLTFGATTSALPFKSTSFPDISNTTSALAARSDPFSTENEAICVYVEGGRWLGKWPTVFGTWQWYIFAKGPWVQDHYPNGEHNKKGQPTHDKYAKHLIDRLHKKCGTIINWHFQYGNIEDGIYDNNRFDGGEGLADFRTMVPTTRHCVNAAIVEASRDFGGEVNRGVMGDGVNCHELKYWVPDQRSLADLWRKVKKKGWDVDR